LAKEGDQCVNSHFSFNLFLDIVYLAVPNCISFWTSKNDHWGNIDGKTNQSEDDSRNENNFYRIIQILIMYFWLNWIKLFSTVFTLFRESIVKVPSSWICTYSSNPKIGHKNAKGKINIAKIRKINAFPHFFKKEKI